LQFCDRRVWSFQWVTTRRLQLRAWPILRTGLRPVQLFLVTLDSISECVIVYDAESCCGVSVVSVCDDSLCYSV